MEEKQDKNKKQVEYVHITTSQNYCKLHELQKSTNKFLERNFIKRKCL